MTPTKALTSRKLFGIYFHACVSHSAFLLRLASHRSTNAEMFERLFEELTDITRKTWNNRVESLVSNAVLHMQAEKTSGGNTAVTCIIRQEKEISNISKALPKLGNTVLPKDVINTHARHWEAHLQSIADFLVPGEGVWWREIEDEDCIEFFDGPEEIEFREQGPSLHHFRSSNIRMEKIFLQHCWEECIQSGIKIPATRIPNEENHNGEECMQQNLPVQDQSFESDGECEEEAEDTTLLIDEEESSENLENNQIPEPQQLSETVQNETGEPLAKKPKLSEDFLPSSKTAKALSEILGTTKDVMLYEKLLKNATKNSSSRYHKEHFLNHLAHIQEQVLKQHKEINEAIVECSTNFKKVSDEIP